MLISRLCDHFIKTKYNRNWENRAISMKRKNQVWKAFSTLYSLRVVGSDNVRWSGVRGLVCDGRFFVSDFGRKGPMLVCDFVTWFGPLSVFICYWHSMRAYTLCTNWGTFFVHLSKIIFKEENGSCEIIGCYVYLLLVFRKSSAILMGYNIAQEQTRADICTLLFVIYMHQE